MNEVTVAIATVGRPDFLRTALQSLRNQINREAIGEIIVSENKGNRLTEAVVREFPELPLRYLFREPQLPMMDHLFSTFRQAKTPFVAILNDDDWWSASHLADGLRELTADTKAAAYTSASLFVVDEANQNPRWIDRSPAVWLLAGKPSWLKPWTLEGQRMMALCWAYTPVHISSMIARTDHLVPVLKAIELEPPHTHTLDRIIFARLALRGTFHYNPVPDTYVRWHADNWIKTQKAETVRTIIQSTVTSVERMAAGRGWNMAGEWKQQLSAMPSEVELEVLERLHQAFTDDDLGRLGLAGFFTRRPPSCRLRALRAIAGNTKRFVLGCS